MVSLEATGTAGDVDAANNGTPYNGEDLPAHIRAGWWSPDKIIVNPYEDEDAANACGFPNESMHPPYPR